ncbi:MAG TPA: YibE/F family protein, partial [Micromonosporaceae bacterium]|nr:YibE/F family protein [Micromonosporaceae bacterium]
AGLAVTFSVLLLFIVPAILNGQAPLLVAIVGSAVIMLSVLFLTHGFTLTTAIAVLGTLASLTVTGVLSAVSTWATRLTGVASEEASFLNVAFQDVNMQGLLLAGILIGSLGVLDDVCVTQAATVTELARANPDLTYGQTYQAATRIGRAHIASVINTIILAYAGASLPLLILLAAGDQPVGELLTSQFLAEEIVRSAVGTIGLITAVPITTALAALAARPLSLHHDAAAAHRR